MFSYSTFLYLKEKRSMGNKLKFQEGKIDAQLPYNNAEREKIAKAGQTKTLGKYSYSKRIEEFLEQLMPLL